MKNSWKEDNTLLNEGFLLRRKHKGNVSFPNQKCVIGLRNPYGKTDFYWNPPIDRKVEEPYPLYWTDEVSEAKTFKTPMDAFNEISYWLLDMRETIGEDNYDNSFFEDLYVMGV